VPCACAPFRANTLDNANEETVANQRLIAIARPIARVCATDYHKYRRRSNKPRKIGRTVLWRY
jgi:hypothetical protein